MKIFEEQLRNTQSMKALFQVSEASALWYRKISSFGKVDLLALSSGDKSAWVVNFFAVRKILSWIQVEELLVFFSPPYQAKPFITVNTADNNEQNCYFGQVTRN